MSAFRNGLFAVTAASVAILPTPSFAAIDPLGTHPVLDQMCDDLLNPSDNSGFTTFAVDVTETETSETVDVGPTTTTGIGPATTTVGNYRSARVNGQSVNIHALVDRVTTYAGGALELTPTKTTITTTAKATCHTHKPTNGNDNDPDHPGYQVAPPGQQNDLENVVGTREEFGTRTSTIPGPWIDPNATAYGEQVVICNSPGKVPGTWRGQNGYTNQIGGKTCSRAWYDTLGSTPSVSLPTV